MRSKIEWTDRSDWNPIRGCTRVSPGCGGPGPHGGCYAEAIAARFSDPGQAFHGFAERTKSGPRWTGKVELQEDRLTLPLRWKKPVRIFASSTSDIFHESLPDEAIDKIFAVMALAPQHTFQVLTKRAERMREYISAFSGDHWLPQRLIDAANFMPAPRAPEEPPEWPLDNVWLGVSVEDQQRADERIPLLLGTPASKRFISAEPLLGQVYLTEWLHDSDCDILEHGIAGTCTCCEPREDHVDWVIAGGESGPGARPMLPSWAQSLRDQCKAAGVAYFHKQNGEFVPDDNAPDAHTAMRRVGKKAAGRLLDGRTWDELPA